MTPQQDEPFSPSSTSEEDNGEPRLHKKTKKTKKLKKQFSDLFRRKNPKDSPEKTDPRPQRPNKLSLNIGLKAPDLIDSPSKLAPPPRHVKHSTSPLVKTNEHQVMSGHHMDAAIGRRYVCSALA